MISIVLTILTINAIITWIYLILKTKYDETIINAIIDILNEQGKQE